MEWNRLLNPSELRAFEIMQPVELTHSWRFFPKVKLGDVLPIRGSGIEDDHFDYATKAHFDFIAVHNNQVHFAIELDGPNHYRSGTAPERDEKKTYLCKRFDLELVRIDLGYLNEVGESHALPLLLQDYLNRHNSVNGQPIKSRRKSSNTVLSETDFSAQYHLEEQAQVHETTGKYKLSKTRTFKAVERGFTYVAKVLQVGKDRYCIGQGSAHKSKIFGNDAGKLADSLSSIELYRKISQYEQGIQTAKSLCEVESVESTYTAPEIFPKVRKLVLKSYSDQ